jgi:thioredoxin-like negative regulator of GroEL
MIEVDNKQDLDAELRKNKRVFTLFYASWCPHCTRFMPVFEKRIGNFEEPSVVYVLLDDYDNPLWDDFCINSVPTVILFEDGEVCRRLDGRLGLGLSERQLQTWLDELQNQ